MAESLVPTLHGDLEHQTGKSRFKRTSKKTYTEQLTHIERWEARIRLMRQKLGMSSEDHAVAAGQEASTLDDHHHIGKSQNSPLHITFFSKMYSHDPACTDFVPNLKIHLLHSPLDGFDTNLRRPSHPFYYARVLGIYHTNVVCTGQEVTTYYTCKMEFLFVRWYKLCGPLNRETDSGWYKLNMLHFVPIAEDDAFGFVNPADVLPSCHLVPAFHEGKLHPDGIGMSNFAQDAQDWKKYYVNWFVDQDMMMQYHWGLGIGHTYACGEASEGINRLGVFATNDFMVFLPSSSMM
ncbi:hypothetical protein SERLA73DRAFT_148890 [Serpula lacrymans var. lacrymans S7.3]|uniref:Uncharacterized protein n=1 Tax=Serpula lacrymans var. lacrymans (strain S7.3) TaxID=936435 RepID=F8PG87_SERL3|nr:hypothetical protein SERLA73DRAFT_148890 [Serpula lacrymans var. lacrymans S7.3]